MVERSDEYIIGRLIERSRLLIAISEEMQKRAIALAQDALSKHSVLREIAGAVKKEFDKEFGSTWHCAISAKR